MNPTALLNIKALKAANLFASKESKRYYLNGVFVTVNARDVFYAATDGHRMLMHREALADGAEAHTLTGAWIVPSEAIKALKGGTGRFADAPVTLAEVGGGEFRLDAPKGSTIFRPIDGSFPDWRRVVPRAPVKDAAPSAQPQFNLTYGASFAEAAELLGYSTLSPHFHYAGYSDPIAVTFGAMHQTFGVLMPIRGSSEEWHGLPVWAGGVAPASEVAAIAAE